MAKLSSAGADMDQNTPIMSPGRLLLVRPIWVVVVVIWAAGACAAEHCTDCHRDAAAPHGGASLPCASCHGGDAAAVTAGAAHTGMVVAPGELANAAQGCGGCHPGQLAGVVAGRMHTGAGMVAVTRTLLAGSDEKHVAGGVDRLDALGEGVADSLLRRLCAGCHLGQPRSGEPGDPVTARGGGCLACHLSKSPHGGHARVGLPVNDGACFGCHSRSGRIALNYAGLAEVDEPPPRPGAWDGLARLSDGRLVERHAADIHHRAGMGCTDCHTGPGLMGLTAGVDIACSDCHDNRRPRVTPATWPADHLAMLERLPFAAAPDQPFLQTAQGTPLWHVELRGDAAWLYPKNGAAPRRVPAVTAAHAPEAEAHAALSCDACHATWAPQCFGCHVRFDPAGSQWDHLDQRLRPGVWRERRWGIRNTLPPLGRAVDGGVRPVIPGMVATIAHPDWPEPLFLRRFAPLAPHTTGRARPCASCHGAPAALGLGEGGLSIRDGVVVFTPSAPLLGDGLPADAWTDLRGTAHRHLPQDPRPFSATELHRLLQLPPPPVPAL